MTPRIRDLLRTWRGGLAFTGIFHAIAIFRLLLIAPDADFLEGLRQAVPGLVVIFVAGCILTFPLLRLVRRFPARHRLLVGIWVAALPFSVLFALFGGLFGPLGILIYAPIPVFFALGFAWLLLARTKPVTGRK